MKSILLSFLLLATAAQAQPAFDMKAVVTGKGAPIVFIPGLISSGDVWTETVAKLSDTYECHVLTLPGFAGQTPLENGPYVDAFQAGITRYIREKGLTGVTLVGHSLGGFLSLKIGIDQPEFLKQIVVVDALPFLAGAMNPAAKPGIDSAMIRNYIASFEPYSQEQIRGMRRMSAKANVIDSTHWDALVDWTMTSDLTTEANAAVELMGTDLRADVGKIRVPVLVLAAFAPNPQFPTFTSDFVNQLYSSQFAAVPDVIVSVTPNARHFIMLDEPVWMVDRIRTFLTK
jgi:pimeloyl-ACP methyl ester carboxylesterase